MRQQTLKRPAAKKEVKRKAIKNEVQEKKKKESKEDVTKEINDEKRPIDSISDNTSTTTSGVLSLADRLALKKGNVHLCIQTVNNTENYAVREDTEF